jgi:hypothetical protein
VSGGNVQQLKLTVKLSAGFRFGGWIKGVLPQRVSDLTKVPPALFSDKGNGA